MDFLLDPNVAYLILLAGVLLGFLALVTPGTGILEVGMIFCLTLAGYAVYNMTFNWWALGILALSVIPFVFAIQKPKRELFLGLSILLMALGSVFIFPRTDGEAGVHPLVALAASILVGGFLWIAVRKSIEAAQIKPAQDLSALIGQIGKAKTPVNEEGSVYVGSELWSAHSEQPIPAGSSVRVIGREGLILKVEKINHSG